MKTLNNKNPKHANCPFLDLDNLSSKGKVHTIIHEKRDDFSFAISNFPFIDGDVPLATSLYGLEIVMPVCVVMSKI